MGSIGITLSWLSVISCELSAKDNGQLEGYFLRSQDWDWNSMRGRIVKGESLKSGGTIPIRGSCLQFSRKGISQRASEGTGQWELLLTAVLGRAFLIPVIGPTVLGHGDQGKARGRKN